MAKGRFASTGVIVGQTPASQWEQKLQHQKGAKVTMGVNVPRQSEGAIGDITVREISTVGLRCYIKTNGGWIDINTMQSADRTQWTPIVFTSNWAHSSSYTDPAYFRDAVGFVHLRGGIVNASGGATDTIFTLPEGFRPPKLTIVAAAYATGRHSVKILDDGVVNYSHGGNTSLSFLDGVSFYATQKIRGSGGGSSSSGEGGTGSGGGGAG
tara:strand:+ start:2586 stop:3218 length:633 start_codon:yes stop_codon:yes gene_type:complete